MAQSVRTEVRPLVSSMPTTGFTIQTGGSARRKVIKNESGTFKVARVPGHSHNASAVLSVLCDLSRTRGGDINLSDPWSYTDIALGAADVGDSLPVDNADARDERAIERGIGEITIIPENCHQEIREPVRAISEIRKLVTAEDRLSTLTYVEEVGGFVDPITEKPYSSDYPDVYVDILHDRGDLTKATLAADDETYTAYNTPFTLQTDDFKRDEAGNGTGNAFVTDEDENLGTSGGSEWRGVVRFRWKPAERVYESDPFTIQMPNMWEVIPGVAAVGGNAAVPPDDSLNQNVSVDFAAMRTHPAKHGYCVLSRAELDSELALR